MPLVIRVEWGMDRARYTGYPIFGVSAAVACMFLVNLCNAVYRCGCRSWWAGAAAHCNIHVPAAKHCPWCSLGTPGFVLAALVPILGAQWLLSFHPRSRPWPLRLILALLAFPVAGALAALLAGWLAGYF